LSLITHDLGVVARIADKVAVMYAGELVETGPTADLFAAPSHPYTRGLLNCIPLPGKTARGAKLGTIPGIVPSLVGEVSGCTFRTRCEHAGPACRSDIPRHLTNQGRHAFRCVDPHGFAAPREAQPQEVQS
jgi:peptide/nickel transport system ATP-binding protein